MRQCQECKYIIRCARMHGARLRVLRMTLSYALLRSFLDVFSELDGEGMPKRACACARGNALGGPARACVLLTTR